MGIIKELGKQKILSPTGKSEIHYLASDNNPAIISKEVFEAVQIEKAQRNNVVKGANGSKRKSEKYSSKKEKKL